MTLWRCRNDNSFCVLLHKNSYDTFLFNIPQQARFGEYGETKSQIERELGDDGESGWEKMEKKQKSRLIFSERWRKEGTGMMTIGEFLEKFGLYMMLAGFSLAMLGLLILFVGWVIDEIV